MLASLLAATLAASAAAAAPPGGTPAPRPSDGLSRRQLAGQRVLVGFPGTSVPAGLERRIHRGELAGVILFSRNSRSRGQLRALTARLQRARPRAAPPLIISTDQEGGLVKRLPGAPEHSPAQLGAAGSARLARSEGLATARNLRGAGVNVDLAPVLDVARPGTNMRRLGRSYSGSAGRVARIGGAFSRGLLDGRVAPTAKHFPGLGLARTDEDRVVNVIRAPIAEVRSVDERPYRALAANLPLAMVSTARYPALDSRPALFSRRIAETELRDRAGFRGVSMSDDLEVPAMLRFGSPARRARLCAQAGVDLLLFAQSETAGAAGAEALRGTSISRMRDAVDRILALRATL